MSKISPLAFIDPEAKIGENCEIGPFCFIDKNVEIGDNNVLMNSVSVLYGARIGNGNVIFPGAVISAVPQDLKFRGEETTAEVGDNNKIRENVTINRGTAAKGKTCVGSGNLLMESVHVAQTGRGNHHRRPRHHQCQRTDAPILPCGWTYDGRRRYTFQPRHSTLYYMCTRAGCLLRSESCRITTERL